MRFPLLPRFLVTRALPVLLAVAATSPVFAQSPIVTARNPARHALSAPRAGNVAITFSQAVTAASAGNVRVFSDLKGGRKAATVTTAGATVTVNPAVDFAPGEVVSVSVPPTVVSASNGQGALRHVYRFTTAAAPAPGTFNGASEVRDNDDYNYGVVLADVDGDGDPDVLSTGYASLTLYLNDGLGGLTLGASPDPGAGFEYGESLVKPADVDGDGDLDLLVPELNQVRVRLNNGSGVFSSGSTVTMPNYQSCLTTADVDGDGDLDLLTTNTGLFTNTGNGVSVRLNNGSGVFSGGSDILAGSTPCMVTTADVDNDGDLDLLTAHYNEQLVRVRLNDGLGTFSGGSNVLLATAPIDDLIIAAAYLTTADADGDGDVDLFILNPDSSSVSIRLNDGTGLFSGGSDVVLAGGYPTSVTTGDVDGDGDLDLVAGGYGVASVHLNNGLGGFGAGTVVQTLLGYGVIMRTPSLADMDGDGDLDLVAGTPFDDGGRPLPGAPRAAAAPAGTQNSAGVMVWLNQPLAAPTITSFTPTSGPIGTYVTITGTNLTGATSVKFNGTSATYTTTSPTTIEVDVPAGATTGPIAVTTSAGTGTSASAFTVVPPTITSFSPTSGPVGTVVHLTGTNFTGATSVKFNGTVATSYSVVSATSISATVPTGTTTGPLSVTTPGGTATSASAFTILLPPTISSVSPLSGPVGTVLMITGTNFTGATSVKIGAVQMPYTVVSAAKISATIPAGAVTGKITVTTPGGSKTTTGNVTVMGTAPTVTGVSPSSGPVGTSVTLTGTQLSSATSVRFNGTAATFTVVSATQITTTVPVGATTGPVSVTTPGGTAGGPVYTVPGTVSPPTISSVTPLRGPVGTVLTINGANLTGATSVKIGSAAMAYSVVSSAKITATIPAGAVTGRITVVTPAGSRTTTGAVTVTSARPGPGAGAGEEVVAEAQPGALALWPNPARERVTVALETAAPGHEGTAVTLYDPLGRPVRGAELAAGAGSVALDVSGLAPGLYTVRCGALTRRLVVE